MPRKASNLIGKKFNRLTVISRYENFTRKRDVFWNCICDCGNNSKVTTTCLVKNKIKSCGCLAKELTSLRSKGKIAHNRLPDGQANFNGILSRYKYNAKHKNREFLLTNIEFRELTQSKCYYCNAEPSCLTITSKRGFTPYIYNGIDRIDSTKGYIKENCVTCCSLCNYMKQESSIEEFKDQIKKIYKNLIKV